MTNTELTLLNQYPDFESHEEYLEWYALTEREDFSTDLVKEVKRLNNQIDFTSTPIMKAHYQAKLEALAS